MKILLVGDMHVRRDNLEESRRLVSWISDTVKTVGANSVVFMGDQFDTHGVAHIEVFDFWKNSLPKLGNVYVIHGNHDMDGSQSLSWNQALEAQANVGQNINQTQTIGLSKHIALVSISYIKDNEVFCETVSKAKDEYKKEQLIVLCHQEFKDADYGNGFYAPHGVNLTDRRLSGVKFVSGHIHKQQLLENKENNVSVFYVGTPRPLSITETEQKNIVAMELIGDQVVFTNVPTPETVAEPFRTMTIKEGETFALPSELKTRTVFEVYGSKDFIKSTLASLPKGSKTRTFSTDKKTTAEYKESEGVSAALARYLKETAEKNNVSFENVMRVIDEVCPEIKGL